MEFIQSLLHIDDTLDALAQSYGSQIYLILFLIVFAETGLVVTPFLPGDSLLFAAGILAGRGTLNVPTLCTVFMIAAFVGDNTNYFVGKYLGPKLLRNEKSKLLNRKHLDKTHAFFEKHGGRTIIIARFVPIVRTFAPFVAGIGAMTYPRFLGFSVLSSGLWVSSCVTLGYKFGAIPAVRKNFTYAVLAIIAISIVPAVVEIIKHRKAARTEASEGGA